MCVCVFDSLNSLEYWPTMIIRSVLPELAVTRSLGVFYLRVATEKQRDRVLLRRIPGPSGILKFSHLQKVLGHQFSLFLLESVFPPLNMHL